jgi:hypothetical protein
MICKITLTEKLSKFRFCSTSCTSREDQMRTQAPSFTSKFVPKSLRTQRRAKWKGKILVTFKINTGHWGWLEAVVIFSWWGGEVICHGGTVGSRGSLPLITKLKPRFDRFTHWQEPQYAMCRALRGPRAGLDGCEEEWISCPVLGSKPEPYKL